MIDEVFADHYLDVVIAAALLRLPPTLTEGPARIPTDGPLARSSADPDDVNAHIDLIGMPWLKTGFESSAAQMGGATTKVTAL